MATESWSTSTRRYASKFGFENVVASSDASLRDLMVATARYSVFSAENTSAVTGPDANSISAESVTQKHPFIKKSIPWLSMICSMAVATRGARRRLMSRCEGFLKLCFFRNKKPSISTLSDEYLWRFTFLLRFQLSNHQGHQRRFLSGPDRSAVACCFQASRSARTSSRASRSRTSISSSPLIRAASSAVSPQGLVSFQLVFSGTVAEFFSGKTR